MGPRAWESGCRSNYEPSAIIIAWYCTLRGQITASPVASGRGVASKSLGEPTLYPSRITITIPAYVVCSAKWPFGVTWPITILYGKSSRWMEADNRPLPWSLIVAGPARLTDSADTCSGTETHISDLWAVMFVCLWYMGRRKLCLSCDSMKLVRTRFANWMEDLRVWMGEWRSGCKGPRRNQW